MIPLDLKGEVFGRLTAVEAASNIGKKRAYRCVCSCGGEIVATVSNLRGGQIQSCGCFRREYSSASAVERNTVHGHNRTGKASPTWKSWAAMLKRCRNPRHVSYQDYGGRGIKVCERWASFDSFLADMGERPDGKTLDRKDVNGDYEPGNCRWATRSEQQKNKRPVK